jgi:hypothetical protein
MAGFPTLSDIAKLDAGSGYPVIDETIHRSRELELFPAATIDGTSMELSVLTTLPTINFRGANQGNARVKAEWATKLFQTAILEQQIAIDVNGVLKSSKDQARTLIAHSKPFMGATIKKIGQSIWYGTSYDTQSFPGMTSQYSADSAHEITASGSTALSSIWFLCLGEENLEVLFGNGASILMQDDWVKETAYDSNNNPFYAAVNWISARPGLRLANKHAAIRISHVGTAAGSTATDLLLGQGLQLARQLDIDPTHIFLTPRSVEQIRASRTSYNPKGIPATRPTDFEGIPLVETNNLSNAEETLTAPQGNSQVD